MYCLISSSNLRYLIFYKIVSVWCVMGSLEVSDFSMFLISFCCFMYILCIEARQFDCRSFSKQHGDLEFSEASSSFSCSLCVLYLVFE